MRHDVLRLQTLRLSGVDGTSLHRKLHKTLLLKGNRVGSLKDKLVELMPTSFLRSKEPSSALTPSLLSPYICSVIEKQDCNYPQCVILERVKWETKPSSPLIKHKLPWVYQCCPISRLNLDQKAQTGIDTNPLPSRHQHGQLRIVAADAPCTFQPHHLLLSRVGLLQKSIWPPWCVNFFG